MHATKSVRMSSQMSVANAEMVAEVEEEAGRSAMNAAGMEAKTVLVSYY